MQIKNNEIMGRVLKLTKLNLVLSAMMIVMIIIILVAVLNTRQDTTYLKLDTINSKAENIKATVGAITDGSITNWSEDFIKKDLKTCKSFTEDEREALDLTEACNTLQDYVEATFE